MIPGTATKYGSCLVEAHILKKKREVEGGIKICYAIKQKNNSLITMKLLHGNVTIIIASKGDGFMDYSRKISERLWNMPDKGELESHREETFIDDIIQKSHIEKELLSHLDGIKKVFDGGAGYGRFSILLAKRAVRLHILIFHSLKIVCYNFNIAWSAY